MGGGTADATGTAATRLADLEGLGCGGSGGVAAEESAFTIGILKGAFRGRFFFGLNCTQSQCHRQSQIYRPLICQLSVSLSQLQQKMSSQHESGSLVLKCEINFYYY